MNELDLTEILKGCEGITLYCYLIGKDVVLQGTNSYGNIVVTSENGKFEHRFTKSGAMSGYPEGGCQLYPSKDQRDWSKFVKPIKRDTIMMCSFYPRNLQSYEIKYYYGVVKGRHYCYTHGNSKDLNAIYYCDFESIIPYHLFDPNDLEGSLEHNIQPKRERGNNDTK